MKNEEFMKRFLIYENLYSYVKEDCVLDRLLIFLERHKKDIFEMDISNITMPMIEFIYKHPHLCKSKNLKRIKYAMDNPGIVKPETLESLEFAKNSFLKLYAENHSDKKVYDEEEYTIVDIGRVSKDDSSNIASCEESENQFVLDHKEDDFIF